MENNTCKNFGYFKIIIGFLDTKIVALWKHAMSKQCMFSVSDNKNKKIHQEKSIEQELFFLI